METAIKRLNELKRGYTTIMWDRVVVRVGDKYDVGRFPNDSVSIRNATLTVEEAAKILCRRDV